MIRRRNTSSRLRQRLTLQDEVRAEDGAGGYTRSWQSIADLWAEIVPISGRERLFADQLQSEVTHKILLRYRGGVVAGQRLIFENRAFNILSVFNTDEENDTLEILALEGVAT
jgi:SPP1 family predicted phage head-tail adaptor